MFMKNNKVEKINLASEEITFSVNNAFFFIFSFTFDINSSTRRGESSFSARIPHLYCKIGGSELATASVSK